MIRSTYKVVRPCAVCNGSGNGRCRVKCHNCNGEGRRPFRLYASDLEGATLTTYVEPPIGPTDPSRRVAPRFVEGERRTFMLASEAHEAGAMMLAYGEIVSYNVSGWDDFSQLSEEDRIQAWTELQALDAAKVQAARESVEHVREAEGAAVTLAVELGTDWQAWDDFLTREARKFNKSAPEAWETARVEDLIRIGMVTPDGTALTPKGIARLNDALDSGEGEAWTRQLERMEAKVTFLADKAAQ